MQEIQAISGFAKKRDYTKLKVSNNMIEYVMAKYGNKCDIEDEIDDVILEDLWEKYGNKEVAKG